ncbi:TIGR04104 family putative zinc finger protein [Peribacillus loiseleuriae]|uniref:TIGR04104 family putative zinc finger protein n=1 Tax=Peribacillus loiseleuriae TaxID=1679170 RepID=UPI003D083025
MNLQKCDKCNTQFKWSKIYKSSFLAYRLQCSQCGTKHKITFLSRIIISLLIGLPLWIFGITTILDGLSVSNFYIFSVVIIYPVLISLSFPFLMKYRSDY